MIILGLNYGEINSSAALIRDGRPVAGAPEERFNRQKFTRVFPHHAVRFVLDQQGVSLPQCDATAQAWNPGAAWLKFNPLVSGPRASREAYFYSTPDNLYQFMPERRSNDWVCMSMPSGSEMPPVYFVRHHACHAANAFFLSPFDEAAILTCDFRGEFECTTFAHGRNRSIEFLAAQSIPHSLGMFYATFTELLGYRPDNDEWKVMALSAFDVDHRPLLEKLRRTYRLVDGGGLELDQAYYKGAILDQPHLYTEKLVELVGGRVGIPGEDAVEWHFQVAKAMQACAEEIVFHFMNCLHRKTRCANLVCSGGFFMNSVVNGKILDNTPFKNVYVSYAPSDVGNSIGAALYVSHCIFGESRDPTFKPSTIGPAFADDEIRRSLERRRITARYVDNMEVEAANILAEGNIVAVMSGAMEFGERALGNRSILADPRPADVKNRINAAIKYREAYRPFAPVVPVEEAHIYFDVPPGFTGPYMEKVVPVREEWRSRLAAVTHVDGSGRVQTVDRDVYPRLHRILTEFGRRSGIPIVLNTSFNINGEPIVLSPDDALNTFFNSGLEYLFLGNHLVRK